MKAGEVYEAKGRLREIVGFHVGKKKLLKDFPSNKDDLLSIAWARPGRGPTAYCSVQGWNRWMEMAKKVK